MEVASLIEAVCSLEILAVRLGLRVASMISFSSVFFVCVRILLRVFLSFFVSDMGSTDSSSPFQRRTSDTALWSCPALLSLIIFFSISLEFSNLPLLLRLLVRVPFSDSEGGTDASASESPSSSSERERLLLRENLVNVLTSLSSAAFAARDPLLLPILTGSSLESPSAWLFSDDLSRYNVFKVA